MDYLSFLQGNLDPLFHGYQPYAISLMVLIKKLTEGNNCIFITLLWSTDKVQRRNGNIQQLTKLVYFLKGTLLKVNIWQLFKIENPKKYDLYPDL